MTDADLRKIQQKLAQFKFDIDIKSIKVKKDALELPKGITITIDKAKIDKQILQDAIDKQKISISNVNISKTSLENAIKGKVIQVEVTPLVGKLRDAIINTIRTTTGGKAPVEVNASTLQNSIKNILKQGGYSINIDTPNLSKKIRTVVNGVSYPLSIHVNPREMARNVKLAIDSLQTNNYNLQINRNILTQSINNALNGHTFYVNIAVTQDQARKAIQNALNAANLINKSDAKTYETLKKGEYYAAKAEQAHRRASDAANTHARASLNLGGAMGSNIRIAGELGAAMGSLYSIHAIKEFLANVVEIGGELEHQKIAMNTIFGDKGKTEELYGKIKGLARQSPFGVMELTKSTKALTAFGVKYNEIYDTAKRLADISAATSVDINRLILALGKTKSRTFLDGVEAKQFAYANIPIYELLSKKLTEIEGKYVSIGEVMERQKKREISYDMVKGVLWDITDPGGKFYNMQEALAGSVKTSWKLVRDNIELMFGDIAESKVGDWLKSLAQVLQKATQNWESFAIAGSIATGSFLLHRLAMLANNSILTQNIGLAIKKTSLTQLEVSANNRAALSYRKLTEAELENVSAASGANKLRGINIFSRKQLTLAEIEALQAKKMLNSEDILRLVSLKKISAINAEYALTTASMAQSELDLTRAGIARAAAAKRSTVITRQLTASFAGLGAAIKSLLFNPFTVIMVAVGGIMQLWQKNKDELNQIKETADGLFTKATEGAKNLSSILNNIKSSDKLSGLEAARGIEELKNAIKDYSANPIRDINDALVDQNGNLRSASEQYSELKKKVDALKVAYDSLNSKGMTEAIESALRATNGFFEDSLATNAEDYSKTLKKRSESITDFLEKHGKLALNILNDLERTNPKFKQELAQFDSYEKKVKAIAEGLNVSAELMKSFRDKVSENTGFDNNFFNKYESRQKRINSDRKELEKDAVAFMQRMDTKLSEMNLHPRINASDRAILEVALKKILDSMENVGDEAKVIIAKEWEESWGVVLADDTATPAIAERFKKMLGSATESGVASIAVKLQTSGYGALSESERNIVDKLMKDATSQVLKELNFTSKEMQRYLDNHQLKQIITLSYQSEGDTSSELELELIKKRGYPGLTGATRDYVHTWTKSGKVYESRNAAQEDFQKVSNELKAAKAAKAGIVEAQKAYDDVYKALQYLGWTDLQVKDMKSNKHNESKKDTVAERFRQEFKDLKDAWDKYREWAKVVGKDTALQKVIDSGLFPNDYDIPTSESKFGDKVSDLIDRLTKAGVKGHDQRESLLNELIKEELSIDKSQIDEYFKSALEIVEQEYESILKNYDLYERIKEATGNDNFAFQLSFGINADKSNIDYASIVKKQFADTVKKLRNEDTTYDTFSNLESVRAKFGDDAAKAWENAQKKLKEYYDKLRDETIRAVEEYQSQEEKIVKIKADAERKKKLIENDKNLTKEQKDKLKNRIDAQVAGDVLRQSSKYLNFFNAIYSLTKKEANEIGLAIQKNLDEKLKAGTISAKEYADEIGKIREQVDKLDNVKSDSQSFLSGGLDELLRNRKDKSQSDINKFSQDLLSAQEKNDTKAIEVANANIESAQAQSVAVTDATAAVAIIDMIVKTIDSVMRGISESFEQIKELADSFGADTGADTNWGKVGVGINMLKGVTDGISKQWSSLKNGDIGGMISGWIQTLTSPITAFNRWHDSDLQARIDKSQKRIDQMNSLASAIERRLASSLDYKNIDLSDVINGDKELERINKTSGAYAVQAELQKRELAELGKQRSDLDKMKDKDKKAIDELDAKIQEQKDKIKDFAINIAESLYGIDLKDWSNQIASALTDAFAAGEDAAIAFDDTVGNIMRNVVSKMIQINYIAPALKELQEYLFGESGVLLDNDLSVDDSIGLQKRLGTLKDSIGVSKDLWDNINNMMGGILDKSNSSANTLSSGIQGVTEDTANLLGSYLNSVRLYCSQNGIDFKRLLDERLPRMSEIAEAQLSQLNTIVENTRRNAIAAESIQESSRLISDTIRRATQSKENGFYIK